MPEPSANPLRGEVVHLYAFDVAYDMKRQPVRSLLGQQVEIKPVASDKRGPRDQFFYRPQSVRLPSVEFPLPGTTGDGGPRFVTVERVVKLFSVGAVSLRFRFPFEVQGIEGLIAYHDPHVNGAPLAVEAAKLADQVRHELRDYYINPLHMLREEEAYTVFCIDQASLHHPGGAEAWLAINERRVAALLTQEPDASKLSELETRDTVSRYLSYYKHDLLVADWDAALLIDEPSQFESMLHVAEMANVQLAELEAYDRILDDAIERAYRDTSPPRSWGHGKVLRDLREIRIDLARLSDELLNTTKFLGDWHLARVYRAISDRFHLADWHRTIDEKLKTLDELYQLLKQDQINRWMMILEITIVLLFVIEVVRVFFVGG